MLASILSVRIAPGISTPPPPPPPVIPGVLPLEYSLANPAYSGHIIKGDDWSGYSKGSDNGYSELKAKPGATFAIGSSGVGATIDMLSLIDHPVFAQVMRGTHPPGVQKTTSMQETFAPCSRLWARFVLRHIGTDTYGGRPTAGGPYGVWYSTHTDTPGESGELKEIFLFTVGGHTRMQIVLQDSGHFATGFGNNYRTNPTAPKGTPATYSEPNAIQTPMIRTANTPVEPMSQAAFQGIYSSSRYGLRPGDTAVPPAPHDARGNGDDYVFILNYEELGPNEYIQRYFFRHETVGGVLNPWPHYCWVGMHITNGLPIDYNAVHCSGNQSGASPGPGKKYLDHGPYILTDVQDPFGVDKYGRY